MVLFWHKWEKGSSNENGTNVKQKKINGTYYCLREDGAVQTGWVCVTGDESDSIEDYRLVDTDGKVRTGWYSAEPPEYLASHYDHDVEWFYFNSKGVPEVGPAKGSAKTSDLKRINGYTHLFNEYGTPVYGIQKVYTSSNGNEYTAYYFGNYPQSSMLTGKYNITEGGVSWPYYFNSTGRAIPVCTTIACITWASCRKRIPEASMRYSPFQPKQLQELCGEHVRQDCQEHYGKGQQWRKIQDQQQRHPGKRG